MWEFSGRNEENKIRHLDLVAIDQKVKISLKLISLPNFEYCNSPIIFLHINIRRLNYMEITSLYFYLQGYSMYAEIPPDETTTTTTSTRGENCLYDKDNNPQCKTRIQTC